MNVEDLATNARDSLTVRRIYGDPVERDGLTVIPVASIWGGWGGGAGTKPDGQDGEGGGFGMNGKASGVYVIGNGHVTWRPAVDMNRAITALAAVAVTYLLTRTRRTQTATGRP